MVSVEEKMKREKLRFRDYWNEKGNGLIGQNFDQ